MNKDQALSRLSALENEAKELKKIIETPEAPPKLTPEQRFWQLCQGLEFKIDPINYSNKVFWFKEGEYWFEYNTNNGYLWCRYKYVWSIFEDEYLLKYDDIQKLIKGLVENHFKCKGVTPHVGKKREGTLVENHFKCKGVTPPIWITSGSPAVENHFKCKGVTPIQLRL